MVEGFTSSPFASWRGATCLPDDCFCETLQEGLVRQPANTWSSLSFVLVAIWTVFRWRAALKAREPALSQAEIALFAATLAIVGLGSAFYHATFTFIGQVLDVSGMYLLATFILLHRLGPKWGPGPAWASVAFVLVNAALMTAQVTTPSLRRVVFGLLLIVALYVEWRESGPGRIWLGRGASLMALAFIIWFVDRQRLVCDPDSWIQGHALWHVLGALAAVCLYRSYEATPPPLE
jgi:predicted membrane channel-forming protein YqfA (hemolysin III family)